MCGQSTFAVDPEISSLENKMVDTQLKLRELGLFLRDFLAKCKEVHGGEVWLSH